MADVFSIWLLIYAESRTEVCSSRSGSNQMQRVITAAMFPLSNVSLDS